MEWIDDPQVWIAVGATLLTITVIKLLLHRRNLKRPLEAEERSHVLKEACGLGHDAMLIVRNQQILFANHAAQKLVEFTIPSPLSLLDDSLKFYDADEKKEFTLRDLLQRHILRKGSTSTHFNALECKNEQHMQVNIEILTPQLPDAKVHPAGDHYIIAIHDTSCQKQLFDLRHLNTLTGLPNQFRAFSDITTITASGSKRNRFAVITIELDEASRLRSMLGYAEMDTIITHIARKLLELEENPNIRVYHLHYVSFMILLQHPSSVDEIYALVEQFQAQVQESYQLLKNRQKISFSAGVSLYPNQGSLYQMIDSAFTALAKAQEEGQGHIILADRDTRRRVDHEIQLNTEIEKGLQNRDFKLYFQPIYDSKDQRLAGAEVLLRWHHPEKGMIMPDLFIGIAERSGLILQIGKYVVEESLKQLSRWNSFGFPPLQLSVNLSLRELENREFMSHLTQLLYQYDTGESRLKFEITEHATMLNPTLAQHKLSEVRQLGIGISLDDFGTGYSSFSHLAEFPIETLKIDRSFVTGMIQESSKRHIVSTITKLGHALGMTIIAEGVESKEEAILLASYDVDYLQGYYFSRPLPQLEFQYLLSHS